MESKISPFITRILKFTAILIYQLFSFLFSIKTNRVVFMAHRNGGLKGNLDYLYKELVEAEPELEAVIVSPRTYPGKMSWLSFSGQMFTVYYYLVTARIFIFEDYCLPLNFIKVQKELRLFNYGRLRGLCNRQVQSYSFCSFGMNTFA